MRQSQEKHMLRPSLVHKTVPVPNMTYNVCGTGTLHFTRPVNHNTVLVNNQFSLHLKELALVGRDRCLPRPAVVLILSISGATHCNVPL